MQLILTPDEQENVTEITNDHTTEQNCIMTMEELAECIQQISKFARGKLNREHLTEKLADMYITTSIIRKMLDITDEEINEVCRQKYARYRQRKANGTNN